MSRRPSNEGLPEALPASDVGRTLEALRPRLQRMLEWRLDPRLRSRLDASDVLQEAYVEITARLGEFRQLQANGPGMPFFLWARLLAGQKLLELHRRHLGALRRTVEREIGLGPIPQASTMSMASALVDPRTPVSGAAARNEAVERVRTSLDGMDQIDREVLVLRYFEELSNAEAAEVLGLSESGAKKRHLRALAQLRKALGPDLA